MPSVPTSLASPASGPGTAEAPPPPHGSTPHLESAQRDDDSNLSVVPVRHPWRWAGVAVVVVLLAQFVHGLITNPGWDWPTFGAWFASKSIVTALGTTIQLTAFGTVLGFALGVVLAAMRMSRSPFLQIVSWGYVWAFRSIPLIVQLLFWFNIAYLYQTLQFGVPFGPGFFSVETNDVLGPLGAAVLGLALHQAAYAAEIIRGGILSVDHGQLEAAAALGIPRLRQFRRIVLPQAMRSILPNAANEVISLFKGTSIVSVMAIPELFYQAQVIYGRNGRVVPLLMVATVWYIVLTSVLSIVQYYLERHYAKGANRTPPPTPWQRARDGMGRVRRAAAPDASTQLRQGVSQ
ncbi:ABC transporter permease subunit [Epidermidibacterium keratini]|uniref:ABC transporter permease subunit n=1 Tax=Epidermidibacterium keratini TaxID=1891644 RepID=A0A7L4YKB4_9ACTN|nr:amino acid ABC transporter permease [Epidermidibacterium keratini]QHB99704.1 ABC transporter permease subunit [Epidermidibacterium keratini]